MRFTDIYGHEKIKNILKRAVETNNVGHAYIFEGGKGVGRYSAALSFASALLCPESINGEPCGECNVCKMCIAKSHPDVRVITNQLYDSSKKSDNLLTDTIRSMKREIYQKPYLGDRKIYIIPNADSMNISAQNSLLKILEEPPLYCTIILIAQNANMFLDTLLSRAVRIRFSPIDESLVAKYLIEKGILEEKAYTAASMSGGSIGAALRIAEDEELYKLRDEVVEKLLKMQKPAYKNAFDLCKFLKAKKSNYREIFSVITSFFTDLIKITEFNDAIGISMKDKGSELNKFAEVLSKGAALELVEITVKTLISVEQNVNYSALMQMMVLDFWEVIHDRSNRSKV